MRWTMRGRKRLRKKKMNRFLDDFLKCVADSVGCDVSGLGKPIPWTEYFKSNPSDDAATAAGFHREYPLSVPRCIIVNPLIFDIIKPN